MIDAFVKAVNDARLPVLGVRVLRGNGERYGYDFEKPIRLNVYSASKSFTATAFGIAMREGLLSPDDRVADIFEDEIKNIPNTDARVSKLKISHLLNMSSGMDRPYLMGEERPFLKERDWLSYCLTRPFVCEPGTRFMYNNADPYIVGRAVQKAAGCDLVSYLQPRLFEPLGIMRPTWETDPEGNTFGAGGLLITIDELAALGMLYLNGGAIGGRQLVDKAFVDTIRTGGISTGSERNDSSSYSCFFWKGCGAFRADGKYNQFSIVLPGKQAVIAVTAFMRGEADLLALIKEHIADRL